jgi:hypothetical protein
MTTDEMIPEDVPDGPAYMPGRCDLRGRDGCDDIDPEVDLWVNVYNADDDELPTLIVCDECEYALKAWAEAMRRIEEEAAVKAKWISDAREMLDWIEARDLVPPNYVPLSVSRWFGAENLPDAIRTLGTAENMANDYQIGARRKFGVHSYSVFSGRDSVCEKVKTGTKVVTKTAEATETPLKGARNVRAVTTTTLVYETDEDVSEWVCPPSLLAPSGE